MTLTNVAVDLGRWVSVRSLKVCRNGACSVGYGQVTTDPLLVAWVNADLRQSRTRRQIADRSQLKAPGARVDIMYESPNAQDSRVSHESVYR